MTVVGGAGDSEPAVQEAACVRARAPQCKDFHTLVALHLSMLFGVNHLFHYCKNNQPTEPKGFGPRLIYAAPTICRPPDAASISKQAPTHRCSLHDRLFIS